MGRRTSRFRRCRGGPQVAPVLSLDTSLFEPPVEDEATHAHVGGTTNTNIGETTNVHYGSSTNAHVGGTTNTGVSDICMIRRSLKIRR